MERRSVPLVDEAIYPMFKKLVKHCFSQRRKQVGTILRKLGVEPVDDLLSDAGIEHTERPEVIGIGRWADLARLLSL
jgi:16S rRNA A1518/A1519 N6-dimethyltransferase RsmA/KsgA/DIM1 with predicted DNA glycosylase/AP lyase activity